MENDNRYVEWSACLDREKSCPFLGPLNCFDENFYFEALVTDSQSCDSAKSPTAQQKKKDLDKRFC